MNYLNWIRSHSLVICISKYNLENKEKFSFNLSAVSIVPSRWISFRIVSYIEANNIHSNIILLHMQILFYSNIFIFLYIILYIIYFLYIILFKYYKIIFLQANIRKKDYTDCLASILSLMVLVFIANFLAIPFVFFLSFFSKNITKNLTL